MPNSCSGERPTSFFGFELTTVVRPEVSVLQTVQALDDAAHFDKPIDAMTHHECRDEFIRWCIGQRMQDILPVLATLSNEAERGLVRCTSLLMQREVELGHDVVLYSGESPHMVVDAWADGIEHIQGIKIARRYAPILRRAEGVFVSKRGIYRKHEALRNDTATFGMQHAIIADSFENELPLMTKADHPVLINPQRSLIRSRSSTDMIFCSPLSSFMRYQAAHEGPRTYNLDNEHDTEAFLNDFYNGQAA